MSGLARWYCAYGLRIRSAVALPVDLLSEPAASEPCRVRARQQARHVHIGGA